MKEHRYILEPYKGTKSRYHCPKCRKAGVFVKYIDTETGYPLFSMVGRCNRESNCGYHYTPKQYFQDNKQIIPEPTRIKPKIQPAKAFSFIPVSVFKNSLKNYEENNFVKYLLELFGAEITNGLISKYFIASSRHWKGATVFWQIDRQGKIRTGKIILYDPKNGKRVKEPFSHIAWAHKFLREEGYELKQCFFGEHLLKAEPNKPVAIVESEKTAIIASVYLSQFVWLAAGSLSNLTAEKCQVLAGKNVHLFPDLGGFEKWSKTAKEQAAIGRFTVSGLLEQKASEPEKAKGLDLADYLIRFNYREFIKADTSEVPAPTQDTQADSKQTEADANWTKDIIELEQFFEDDVFLPAPLRLSPHSTITDPLFFAKSHLAVVKAQNGKRAYLPYLERLQELKNHISKQQQ